MAISDLTTRRFALLGALASSAALAVPAVKAAQHAQDVDLSRLSSGTVVMILKDVFDHSSFDQQNVALASLRDGGPELSGIADILDARRRSQFKWRSNEEVGLPA